MVPGKVQLRSLPDDPDIRYFVYVPKSLDGTGRVLVAVHDLRLCFDLQLAQLLAQAGNGLLQLFDVELKGANLLAQAR